ncbi:MAG: SusE domain-containing protein [Edaphocola sp.]
MKNIFGKFLLLCAATSFLFGACSKKENKVYYNDSNASLTLEASASSVYLVADQATETVVSFTWTKPDFGYNAGVVYTLQFALPTDDSFADAQEVSVEMNEQTASLTGSALNQITIKLGLSPDTLATIQVRVVGEAAQNGGQNAGTTAGFGQVFSSPITLKVTPYTTDVTYPSVYAVGAFQGWDASNGTPIYSLNSDGNYEGYINVENATDNEFKFTSQLDWNGTNYGSAADPTTSGYVTTGTISTDNGAGNLKLPGAGYFRLKLNTTSLTWEAYQTTWGLIGSATSGGWDNSTAMTYDATNKVWVIETVALAVGEFKFRANDAWDLSYGLNTDGDKLTSDNGANISVSEAGNYKVVLDLTNSTNYNYTLTKL